MLFKRGISVSPGVVYGPAFILDVEGTRITQRFVNIDAVDAELARFRAAVDSVLNDLLANQKLATQNLGEKYGMIFAAHQLMLTDPKLITEIEHLIEEKCYSPEFATAKVLGRWAKKVQNAGDADFAERASDVIDLEKRLLRTLQGERREELANLTSPVIVLAHNLTPSETANLNPKFVLGFATEAGGRTSHTAILAGALGIPAVVGLGDFLADVSGGEPVILNGTQGEVVIEPDADAISNYEISQKRYQTRVEQLATLTDHNGETRDGVGIRLMGNIEFPHEAALARQRGAEGIGLYRTEFLYLGREIEPNEADHYEAYCKVIQTFPDDPVVIRTLDLGADKMPVAFRKLMPAGVDPNLGLRSIRWSLKYQAQFKTQLRAILRAAVHGDVRIMFPLVSTLLEFRQARMLLQDVIEDLAENEAEIPFQRDVPVGMMVEVPAAAIMAREFAREVDFFSIGTNDLIQYTLACDRSDPNVANLYRAADPSILRLIHNVIQAGQQADISVNVCGQMSSDPLYIPLLVGMGLRQLSITPQTISEVKEVLLSFDLAEMESISQKALTFELARDVENYLRAMLKERCADSSSFSL